MRLREYRRRSPKLGVVSDQESRTGEDELRASLRDLLLRWRSRDVDGTSVIGAAHRRLSTLDFELSGTVTIEQQVREMSDAELEQRYRGIVEQAWREEQPEE